jgi:hypothetical protein
MTDSELQELYNKLNGSEWESSGGHCRVLGEGVIVCSAICLAGSRGVVLAKVDSPGGVCAGRARVLLAERHAMSPQVDAASSSAAMALCGLAGFGANFEKTQIKAQKPQVQMVQKCPPHCDKLLLSLLMLSLSLCQFSTLICC